MLGEIITAVAIKKGMPVPDWLGNLPVTETADRIAASLMDGENRAIILGALALQLSLIHIFLFPWASAMKDLGWEAFVAIMIFLAELVAGFWYIWKKGALNWE